MLRPRVISKTSISLLTAVSGTIMQASQAARPWWEFRGGWHFCLLARRSTVGAGSALMATPVP
jgi:hypothetical protein